MDEDLVISALAFHFISVFSVTVNKLLGVAVNEGVGDPTRGVTNLWRGWMMLVYLFQKGLGDRGFIGWLEVGGTSHHGDLQKEELVAFVDFSIQHQTVAELFSSFGFTRRDVFFFLMENSGSFYFVENFKILAVYPQMGILSEFGHTESRDKWGCCFVPSCSAPEQPVLKTLTCTLAKPPWAPANGACLGFHPQRSVWNKDTLKALRSTASPALGLLSVSLG